MLAHNRVAVTFHLSVSNIDARSVSLLAELLAEAVSCQVDTQPDLFSTPEENRAPAKATEAEAEEVQLTPPAPAAQPEPGSQKALPQPTDDVIYNEAVRLVIDAKRASASFLQRSLKISYNRAVRLVERMEKDHIISEMDASGGRVVFKKPGQDAA